VSFFVTVRVPSNARDFTHVGRLSTSLPAFDHVLGDLGGAVRFGALSFDTGNSSVDVVVRPRTRFPALPPC
jgi:hypothetical protein